MVYGVSVLVGRVAVPVPAEGLGDLENMDLPDVDVRMAIERWDVTVEELLLLLSLWARSTSPQNLSLHTEIAFPKLRQEHPVWYADFIPERHAQGTLFSFMGVTSWTPPGGSEHKVCLPNVDIART